MPSTLSSVPDKELVLHTQNCSLVILLYILMVLCSFVHTLSRLSPLPLSCLGSDFAPPSPVTAWGSLPLLGSFPHLLRASFDSSSSTLVPSGHPDFHSSPTALRSLGPSHPLFIQKLLGLLFSQCPGAVIIWASSVQKPCHSF